MRSSIQQHDDDKNQIENKLAQPTIVKYGPISFYLNCPSVREHIERNTQGAVHPEYMWEIHRVRVYIETNKTRKTIVVVYE